jgi:3-oxoacyl-(acyl-carrier-protein) synthase
MDRRVVITGLGVVAPNGVGLAAFQEALERGRSGIRFDPRLAELNFGCQVAGIPPVEAAMLERHFTAEQLRAMNSCMTFAGLAALECWRDAGFTEHSGSVPDWESGAIFGNGIGGMDTIAERVVPLTNAGAWGAPRQSR